LFLLGDDAGWRTKLRIAAKPASEVVE